MKLDVQRRPLVVHLTSVHGPRDTRIFEKEARTLARHGYSVTLLAPDADRDTVDGVNLTPLFRPNHRLGRMVLGSARAYRQARRLRASVYHIHDPELLLAAWRLMRADSRVIYDAHEDTPAQILDKEWIAKPLRRPIAWAFDKIERSIAGRLAGVVAATEKIAERFADATVIHNYPDLTAIPERSRRVGVAHTRALYVGALTRARGAVQMVRAMSDVRSPAVVLDVVGAVRPPGLAAELQCMPGAARTIFHGQMPWDDSWQFASATSDVGLLLYQPARNHVEALPTKMFEYMAVGLPIIASDFPLWRRILEESGAGLVVDPQNPQAIAAAIDQLASDPPLREQMGRLARKAAVERYNWRSEEQRLLELYCEVLSEDR